MSDTLYELDDEIMAIWDDDYDWDKQPMAKTPERVPPSRLKERAYQYELARTRVRFNSALMFVAIGSTFIAGGILVGRTIPVAEPVVAPAPNMIPGSNPGKLLKLVEKKVYIPVESDDFVDSGKACNGGAPVLVQSLDVQENDEKQQHTYLKVQPVGQKNSSFCTVAGGWDGIIKVGEIISLNSGSTL